MSNARGNRQVRLEADVVEALEADPANEGLSLSAAANRALREGRPRDPVQNPGQAGRPVRHVSRQELARRGGTPVRRQPGDCPHPITRRIGDRCAVCGDPVR